MCMCKEHMVYEMLNALNSEVSLKRLLFLIEYKKKKVERWRILNTYKLTFYVPGRYINGSQDSSGQFYFSISAELT